MGTFFVTNKKKNIDRRQKFYTPKLGLRLPDILVKYDRYHCVA